MSNYYGQSAYRSDQPRQQPEQELLPHLGFAERLPWGHTNPRLPSDLQGKGIFELAIGESKRLEKYQPNIPAEKWTIYNHEYLQPANISKFSIFLNIFLAACKVLAIPIFILVLIEFFWEYLDGTENIVELFYNFPLFLLLLPFVFFFLWGLGILITKFCPQILMIKGNGQLKWRVNRRTGMVSKFTYPKKGEVVEQTAPFDEFDAYLCISPTRHGFLFDFMLYHRYDQWLIGMEELLGTKNTEYFFMDGWEFLQNYMDTSKPLPEHPLFEIYRHLDPTTAAYDKATNRDPNKLIKMTNKQWQAFSKEQLNNSPEPEMRKRLCLFQEGGYVHYLPSCEWPPTYK